MSRFRFKKFQSDKFGEVHKPYVPVSIAGPRQRVRLEMLVDSGADISLLPYSVGEALGLPVKIKNRREVLGVGGDLAYILSQVTLRIADDEVPIRIGWAMTDNVPLLLGRLDVFRHFAVEFREFEDKIILTRAPREL